MTRIDAHLHFAGDHEESVALLRELDLKLLNVCVAADSSGRWRAREAQPYRALAEAHPDRYAWVTTFDLPGEPDFADPAGYARRCIDGIEADYAGVGGAVGVKVWKSIGMDLRAPDGHYVMIDEPIFEPILRHLEETHKTLLAHLAEPLACWEPLEKQTPHQGYYTQNRKWHMHGRTDVPSHAQIIAARDRVVAHHPKLRCVGAHLGSLEYSVEEIAARFERFPNYAVDNSARTADLACLDREAVRALFARYPDRFLFGTDIVYRTPHSTLPAEQRTAILASYRSDIERQLKFFSTDEPVRYMKRDVSGLALPESVLRRFFTDNARQWYPGL